MDLVLPSGRLDRWFDHRDHRWKFVVGKMQEREYLTQAKKLTYWISGILVGCGFLVLLITSVSAGARHGCWSNALRVLGAGGGLAGASLSVGGLLGFLFGVPRGPEKSTGDRPWVVNTNLVQISDWLTKMLVGLSLAVLFQIPDRLSEFGKYFGEELGSESLAVSFLIHFGASGFLIGYLMTRLFLQQGFHEADLPPEAKDKPNLAPGKPREDKEAPETGKKAKGEASKPAPPMSATEDSSHGEEK